MEMHYVKDFDDMVYDYSGKPGITVPWFAVGVGVGVWAVVVLAVSLAVWWFE